MRIIEPSFEFLDDINGQEILQKLEKAGRTCYKSEHHITEKSAEKFIKNIIKRGHDSVLEHAIVSVKVICDRGVSHEIVRHRIASYSQESTRYVAATGDKYNGEMEVIRPCFWSEDQECYKTWKACVKAAETAYKLLLELGATAQEARSVLPNSLKTEIVMTLNLRAWRHFFKLRCDATSHPQMIQIAIPMLSAFSAKIPIVFDDLKEKFSSTKTDKLFMKWGPVLYDTTNNEDKLKLL